MVTVFAATELMKSHQFENPAQPVQTIGIDLSIIPLANMQWANLEKKYFKTHQYQNCSAENLSFAFEPGAAVLADEDADPAEGESYCSYDEAGDIRVASNSVRLNPAAIASTLVAMARISIILLVM